MILGKIEVIGLRDAQGRFQRWETQLEAAQRNRVRELTRQAHDAMFGEAPESRNPGPHMREGLTFRTRVMGRGEIDAAVYATGPKAHLVPLIRGGTPPHVIRARPGGVLRFAWPSGPRGQGIYFYKQVQHPGTKPNDFVLRAWTRIQGPIIMELRRIAAQVVQGVTG